MHDRRRGRAQRSGRGRAEPAARPGDVLAPMAVDLADARWWYTTDWLDDVSPRRAAASTRACERWRDLYTLAAAEKRRSTA